MAEETNEAPQTVTLKVNGEDIEKPIAEVVAIAQKNLAADKALENARRLESENQNAIALAHDIQLARGGDPDAMRRVMVKHLGNDPQEVEEYFNAMEEALASPAAEATPGKPAAKPAAGASAEADNPTEKLIQQFMAPFLARGLSPQDAASALANAVVNQGQNIVRDTVQKSLDKLDSVRYAISMGVDKDALREFAESALMRRMGPNSRNLTTDDVEAAAAEAGAFAQKLVAKLPKKTDDSLGLGAVPSAGGLDTGHRVQGKAPSINDADAFERWTTDYLRRRHAERESAEQQ